MIYSPLKKIYIFPLGEKGGGGTGLLEFTVEQYCDDDDDEYSRTRQYARWETEIDR
jgi:hypothetical protein